MLHPPAMRRTRRPAQSKPAQRPEHEPPRPEPDEAPSEADVAYINGERLRRRLLELNP